MGYTPANFVRLLLCIAVIYVLHRIKIFFQKLFHFFVEKFVIIKMYKIGKEYVLVASCTFSTD